MHLRDESELPANVEPPQVRPLPRLSIGHLMLVTFMATILLALTREQLVNDYYSILPDKFCLVCEIVLATICIPVIAVLANHYTQKGKFPLLPGHLLAILVGYPSFGFFIQYILAHFAKNLAVLDYSVPFAFYWWLGLTLTAHRGLSWETSPDGWFLALTKFRHSDS
jgi:hypothetical protein